jgi:PKD repeat protein
MINKQFKLIGTAVLGLILTGVAVPSALTQPLRVVLTASVMDQQCAGGNGVNVTLTATLTPPKSGATFKWDFDNDGVFDTQPSTDPTVTHLYPDEVPVTATVAVMKGNRVKGTDSVRFRTIRCP